jgi:TIR domain/PAN domain
MDVDNIPMGVDFKDYLAKQVSACDIFLAVIGPNWLNAKDKIGNRRLENPNDFVAVEIAAALKRNIPVVPVLVDGARVPSPDELPEPLRPLAWRNGRELRNALFKRDVDALTEEIRRTIESGQPWLVRWRLAAIDLLRRRWGVVVAGVLVGLFAGLLTLYLSPPTDLGRADMEKALAEARAVAEKATAEKEAAERKAAAMATANRDAQQKAAEADAEARRAAEKAAAERDVPQKAAADRAAKEAAEKAAADRAAAQRAAADKAAADKAAAEKTAAAQKAAAENAAAERKLQALGKFTTRKNRDILTNDIPISGIIGTAQPDIGACAVQCDDTPACKAFSFDHVLSKCYLKSNVATSVIDPRSTIAAKSPLQLPNASNAKPEMGVSKNTRIVNNDPPTSRERVADVNACKATCEDSLSCVAFTFLKAVKNENCEMFDGLRSFANDNSADSGYKYQSK